MQTHKKTWATIGTIKDMNTFIDDLFENDA